jgi:DNA-binding transcriptional LysR family regulator
MIAFREAYPKVNVRLIRHEGSMLAQIEREELDLAVSVRPSTPLPGDMRWLPLLRKPFVLIAPAWIEAAHWREAMQSRPLLRYDGSSPSGLSVDAFLERTGAKVGNSIWINYLDTMISLVASGVGVALIPTSLFGEAAPAIRTFELGADTFYREVGVLWRPDTPQRGSINSLFIDTLAREAAREPLSECLIATRQSALA